MDWNIEELRKKLGEIEEFILKQSEREGHPLDRDQVCAPTGLKKETLRKIIGGHNKADAPTLRGHIANLIIGHAKYFLKDTPFQEEFNLISNEMADMKAKITILWGE